MTIVNFGPAYCPELVSFAAAATPSLNNITLNASGDKYGAVLRVRKAGDIHRIGLLVGTTVTSAVDLDVRIETVSSQVPSGSLWATNTNGTIAAGSVTTSTFVYATLTADATVAVGDLIGISVVAAGSPNLTLSRLITNGTVLSQMPYMVDGSTGTYSASGNFPIFAIEYSDGSYAYEPYLWPISAINTHTFNSGSTPDELAIKFQFAAPTRVCGGWVAIDLDNTIDVVLYDNNGSSVLQSVSLTNSGRESTSGASPYLFFFTPQTLSASTNYYLAFKPGASNFTIYSHDVPSAAALDQMGGGQSMYYSSRADAGSWSDTATRRLFAGLLIDGIDDGSGGAAGIQNLAWNWMGV